MCVLTTSTYLSFGRGNAYLSVVVYAGAYIQYTVYDRLMFHTCICISVAEMNLWRCTATATQRHFDQLLQQERASQSHPSVRTRKSLQQQNTTISCSFRHIHEPRKCFFYLPCVVQCCVPKHKPCANFLPSSWPKTMRLLPLANYLSTNTTKRIKVQYHRRHYHLRHHRHLRHHSNNNRNNKTKSQSQKWKL